RHPDHHFRGRQPDQRRPAAGRDRSAPEGSRGALGRIDTPMPGTVSVRAAPPWRTYPLPPVPLEPDGPLPEASPDPLPDTLPRLVPWPSVPVRPVPASRLPTVSRPPPAALATPRLFWMRCTPSHSIAISSMRCFICWSETLPARMTQPFSARTDTSPRSIP